MRPRNKGEFRMPFSDICVMFWGGSSGTVPHFAMVWDPMANLRRCRIRRDGAVGRTTRIASSRNTENIDAGVVAAKEAEWEQVRK